MYVIFGPQNPDHPQECKNACCEDIPIPLYSFRPSIHPFQSRLAMRTLKENASDDDNDDDDDPASGDKFIDTRHQVMLINR